MCKVAIVTVGFNGQDYTETCINSIYENTKLSFDLIAVNNGSTDDTLTILDSFKQKHTNFHVITSEKNLGFAGGYNLGMKYALDKTDCDYVFIINNDTYVPKDAIQHLVNAQVNLTQLGYKQVGAVGPVSNFVIGRQCITIPQISTYEDIQDLAEQNYSSNKEVYKETGYLIGFAVLYTRQALKEVGLFDESFEYGNWEDTDMQVRMRAAGFLSFIAEDTFIYHYGSKTCIEIMKDVPDFFHKNKSRFTEKWNKLNNNGSYKKIVGACRVRNGELYLNDSLEAVSRMCEEVIVLDDHSTDKTKEICETYANVHVIDSPFSSFDEARDRNYVLDYAKTLGAEWIWCFDADEVPEEALIENIQSLVNADNPLNKVYLFKVENFWDSPRMIRLDGANGVCTQGRLFKVEPNQEIKSLGDDNLHCGSHPYYPEENRILTKFRIKHYGMMDSAVRKSKYAWYTKTDTDKNLELILGGNLTEYYKKLYGYAVDEELLDSDCYRHIIDETNIQLVPWVERPTISLCIIAKNEEKHIKKLLESAKVVADEIIVTIDSKSTDKTEEICREYTSNIYKWTWNDSGFSGMRNFCMSKATGHWILFLDGDEVIPKGVGPALLAAARHEDVTAFMCKFKNWQDGDKEGISKWELSETFRFFKNEPYLYFVGAVHEDLSESLEKAAKFTTVKIDKLNGFFYNYGYLKDPAFVNKKHEFYAKLLERQLTIHPEDCRAHLNYATHLSHIGDLDKAEKHFKAALAISPNLWMAHNGLGVIYYKRALQNELLTKAQLHFQRALACSKITPLLDKSKVSRVMTNFQNINTLRNNVA